MKRSELSWPELNRLATGLALLGGSAMSFCFCLNLLSLDDLAGFLTSNELSFARRNWFLATMGAAFVLPALLSARWIKNQPLAVTSRTLWDWGHRAAPLIVVGLAAPLLVRSVFIESPLVVLLWALVVGLIAAISITGSLEHGGMPRKLSSPLERFQSTAWLPTALIVTASLALFVHFAVYSLMRHYRMESASYDLGIFDNLMWSLMHGDGFYSSPAYGPEGNHLARHATFAAPLLLPIYALFPRAETLLVIQALMVASTPIPIYLMVRRIVGSAWVGCALGLAYAVYAPLHGAVFFDFHFLTSAPPLIAWVFYLLQTDRDRALMIMTAIALAWREDIGAILAGGGALVFLRGDRRTRAFVFTLVCTAYFMIVKFALMPVFGESATFAWIYKELWPERQRNFGGVLQTLLTNPTYAFETLLDPKKLLFALQLFVPVLFFPLRHRFAWVAVLLPAVFTLLATGYPPAYEISFQYSAYWGPTLFLATAVVLHDRFAASGRRASLTGNVVAILLVALVTSFHFGSIFESPIFRTGFTGLRYEVTEEDREQRLAFQKLAAHLPADAIVAATDTEAPHLSARQYCYTLRFGYHDAEYLLVKKAHIRKRDAPRERFKEALATGQYGLVAVEGDFLLWKRGHSTERNPEGRRLLKLRPPPKKAPELHPTAP